MCRKEQGKNDVPGSRFQSEAVFGFHTKLHAHNRDFMFTGEFMLAVVIKPLDHVLN